MSVTYALTALNDTSTSLQWKYLHQRGYYLSVYMNKAKYQVFVSSTYDDLKEERDQVIKAILEMGHIPVGMEMFSAADEEQWQIIARQIDDSDYYVVIVANRYGSMVEGISYTEKEYDYAAIKGVPTLGFVLDSKAPWPSNLSEVDKKAKTKLEAFKKKVKAKPVNFWSSKADLHGMCAIALGKAINTRPRPGWIRSPDAVRPEVASELSRLSSENAKLREENAELKKEVYTSEFVQGEDPVELTFNVFNYSVEVIISTTWNKVFYAVAKVILNDTSQGSIYTQMGKSFTKEVYDSLPPREEPVNFRTFDGAVSLRLQNGTVVKDQLFALGLIKIVSNNNPIPNPSWTLTELGERQYGLVVAKRR